MRLTLKSIDGVKQIAIHCVDGLIYSVEGLKRKRLRSPKEQGILLSRPHLKMRDNTHPSPGLQAAGRSTDFAFASSPLPHEPIP